MGGVGSSQIHTKHIQNPIIVKGLGANQGRIVLSQIFLVIKKMINRLLPCPRLTLEFILLPDLTFLKKEFIKRVMGKVKQPVFSLGGSGTLGDALTIQKSRGEHIVREKPTPANPRSLAQMYQRWLYEDYVAYWTQQSAATKQTYQTAGSRYHLTGFQYWMKYHLTKLPDIAGMWHLDEVTGTIARDFSRNANNGTIFGSTPTLGLISGGRLFDGIDDRIMVPDHPTLKPSVYTVMAFFNYKATAYVGDQQVIGKYRVAAPEVGWQIYNRWTGPGVGLCRVRFREPGISHYCTANINMLQDYHVAFTYDGTDVRMLIDGAFAATVATPDVTTLADLSIGGQGAIWPFDGMIDHCLFFNRVLADADILRHSLRRYPL